MKWYWIVAISVVAIALGYGLYHVINNTSTTSTGTTVMSAVPGTGTAVASK